VVGKVAAGEALQQTDDGYGVLPGLKLRDEIGRYFQVDRALWQRFDTAASGSRADAACRLFTREVLTKVLGFPLDEQARRLTAAGFELLSAKAGRVPLVIAGSQGLDRPETIHVAGGETIHRSAITAFQGELKCARELRLGIGERRSARSHSAEQRKSDAVGFHRVRRRPYFPERPLCACG
jgi:hypothetical protein